MARIRAVFALDAGRRNRHRARSDLACPRTASTRSAKWASPASASACRISSRRCRRRSAGGNPTSRPRIAPPRRARLGVGSINLDLIYGLPLQTEESVARTARRALALSADRVAVFGYAHVPWMKKHQQLIPEERLPGPAARFAQQRAIHRVLDRGRRLRPGRPRPLRAPRRRDGGGGGDARASSAASRATPPTARRR